MLGGTLSASKRLCVIGVGAIGLFARAPRLPAGEGAATFEEGMAPFLAAYCTGCHGGEKKRADLALDAYHDEAAVLKDRKVWEKVLKKLLAHEMPPEKKPQPSEVEREAAVRWIDARLSKFDCSGRVDPGRVTIRRLNRAEYRNTVRDLLGVDFRPADGFPADDVGYGFDNIGDVLSLPPLLVERYVEAAEAIAAEVVAREKRAAPRRRLPAERLEAAADVQALGDGALSVNKEGEVFTSWEVPADGEYYLRAAAYGQQAGPEPVRMAFRVDGKEIGVVQVKAEGSPAAYEVRVRIEAGKRRCALAYLNNYYNPDDPDPAKRGDRNLILDWFELERAGGAPPGTEADRPLFSCAPASRSESESCAREVLGGVAARAWRRPLKDEELDRLSGLAVRAAKASGSFEEGVELALAVILSSPHFLFRVEVDPEPENPDAIHPLNGYELASRLSYFLWSSMPDAELFRLAAEGRLDRPEVLEEQVRRMLADPRSRALVDNFAGQWLQTRFLESMSPDPALFPGFDARLRDAMRTETLMFFEAVLREDRSILDFIDADFTFLNERLARHYGMDGPKGEEFQRVALESGVRGGVLTQASILTLTSNPTRTSPVKRGRWVLEQILGEPPPPPPPNVPELKEDQEAVLSGPLRERMEKHRADPNCSVCHQKMDAIGFAFENFDAVGKWRDFDGKFQIDPAGTLPDGSRFEGPEGLKSLLKSRQREFARALAERMLTYALGRGLEHYDGCAVEKIVDALAASAYRFSSMINAIVKADPFLKRRGGSIER